MNCDKCHELIDLYEAYYDTESGAVAHVECPTLAVPHDIIEELETCLA